MYWTSAQRTASRRLVKATGWDVMYPHVLALAGLTALLVVVSVLGSRHQFG